MRIIVILGMCFTLFYGCKKHQEAPVGYVDIYINLNSILNNDLISGAGYMYFNHNSDGSPAGANGIIVYKILNDYLVYERACPIDHSCQVFVNEGGVLMECPCCSSTFTVIDGSPVHGEAHYMLRQYRSHLEGNMLYINNY